MSPVTATTTSDVLRDESLLRDSAYIDGGWIRDGGSGRFPVDNPSTGELIAELPSLSRAEVAGAIDAAGRALPAGARGPASSGRRSSAGGSTW